MDKLDFLNSPIAGYLNSIMGDPAIARAIECDDLKGIERLKDPIVRRVIELIPTATARSDFEIQQLKGGPTLNEGDLKIWLTDDLFPGILEAQRVADITGKTTFLVLDDSATDYWNELDASQEMPLPVGVIQDLKKEGEYWVSADKKNRLHHSRAIAIESRGGNLRGFGLEQRSGEVHNFCSGLEHVYLDVSLLDAFWLYWQPYISALKAIRQLIKRKDFLLITDEDLEDTLARETNKDAVMQAVVDVARRTLEEQGILYSSDRREAQFVSRELGFVADLAMQLKSAAIAASGLTETTLFNYSDKGSGIASMDLGDRLNKAESVSRLQGSWGRALRPLAQKMGFRLVFVNPLQLTPVEISDIYLKYAQADSLYSQMLALSPEEIRSRIAGGWTVGLTLNNSAYKKWRTEQEELQKMEAQPVKPAEPTKDAPPAERPGAKPAIGGRSVNPRTREGNRNGQTA